MNKPNINAMWDYVKEHYPDARFSFWYRVGELQFWPSGKAEAEAEDVYACIIENGKFRIMMPEEI